MPQNIVPTTLRQIFSWLGSVKSAFFPERVNPQSLKSQGMCANNTHAMHALLGAKDATVSESSNHDVCMVFEIPIGMRCLPFPTAMKRSVLCHVAIWDPDEARCCPSSSAITLRRGPRLEVDSVGTEPPWSGIIERWNAQASGTILQEPSPFALT
jgi:hypothetical protein